MALDVGETVETDMLTRREFLCGLVGHGLGSRRFAGFKFLRHGLKPMPLSIHMEYLGYRVFEKPEMPAAIQAQQHDIQVLHKWLAE